jgi:hypothetical protein
MIRCLSSLWAKCGLDYPGEIARTCEYGVSRGPLYANDSVSFAEEQVGPVAGSEQYHNIRALLAIA